MKTRRRRTLSLLLIISIYVIAAFASAANVFSYGNYLIYCITAFALAVLATTWVLIDSQEIGKPVSRPLRIVMLLTVPISILVYLIYSRGWKGLGWAAAHSAIYLLVWFAAFKLMYRLVYASGYWELFDPIFFQE